jgi:transposase
VPTFVAIGIDSSDDHHDIHAEAAGSAAVFRLRISNDLDGFQRMLQALSETFADVPRRYAIENPSLLLGRFLLHSGAAVYAVNPRSVASMRKALSASGKKDDRLDAHALSLLLRERADDLTPIQSSSPEGTVLAGLVAQRVDVVEEKNRLLNQLAATLKGYYPRALELFSNPDQPISLAFLQAFASPTELAAATREDWDRLFAGQRYPQRGRIAKLWEQARLPQVPVSPADETLGARQVRRLVRSLRVLDDELAQVDEEIKRRFDDLPEASTFRSLPGAADVLAPALFAVFGDNRERWADWRDIGRLSGTVPITRTSGRARSVMMRHHCDHRARRTLHLFAGCSRKGCVWANDFYVKQRNLGKSHGTALRNLATKWLRILFRLWQDGTVYDEAEYLKRRSGRQAVRSAPASQPG